MATAPKLNALQDIEFIKLNSRRTTVREAMLHAHEHEFQLDQNVPGYVYTAQLRLLSQILAVVLREMDISTIPKIKKILSTGLDQTAIDTTIESLLRGSLLADEKQPFMQRPAVNTSNPKEKATFVGADSHPVKKLSPSMPPDEAEEFWDFRSQGAEGLPLEDAVLQLVVYHHMSLAGNNAYCGDKCVSGSPAMRFVGAENSATEMVFLGETLLATLLQMTPLNWVRGSGLPAWADRQCELSRSSEGIHPLWAASWSSNAPATAWEGNQLVGVRTGGIPKAWWLPEMGIGEQRKEWWTRRNEEDPFYLYIDNGKELKLQRLDLGKDATALAVDWAAENKSKTLIANHNLSVLIPQADLKIAFARHRMEGTASSPNIRASEVYIPSPDKWAFDMDQSIRDAIANRAESVQNLHRTICSPFRRERSNERDGGRVPLVLDFLEDLRPSVSDEFWRQFDSIFSDLLREIRESAEHCKDDPAGRTHAFYQPITHGLADRMKSAAMLAFDTVTNPYFGQDPARISHVRSGVSRRVNAIIRQGFLSPLDPVQEKK